MYDPASVDIAFAHLVVETTKHGGRWVWASKNAIFRMDHLNKKLILEYNGDLDSTDLERTQQMFNKIHYGVEVTVKFA